MTHATIAAMCPQNVTSVRPAGYMRGALAKLMGDRRGRGGCCPVRGTRHQGTR